MAIKELPIPPAARGSASAIELLRVWAAEGSQHVSLATDLWRDPAAWGLLLVDLARHVANSYAETTGIDSDFALARIREAFEVELSHPTDNPTGELAP